MFSRPYTDQGRSHGVARVAKTTPNPLYEKNYKAKKLILTFTLHNKCTQSVNG